MSDNGQVPEAALALFSNGGFWEGLRLYTAHRRAKLSTACLQAKEWESVLKSQGADAEVSLLNKLEEAVKDYDRRQAAQKT